MLAPRWFVVPLLTLVLTTAPAQQPDAIAIEKDITYGKGGGEDLKLDLARPAKGEGPFPAVVCIHGGAWQYGARSAHHATIRQLAQHGYVAVTISYRLAPKHKFPAQIEDAKCAVRYLRANARKLNIDPNRIAALGDSAGGHLSLLLGLMDAKDGLEGDGGHAGVPSKVNAVVNYYGPTDFVKWRLPEEGEKMLKAFTKGKDSDALLRDFLGTHNRKAEVMAKVSPVTYLDAKDPPVLTLQGDSDPLVPLDQAKLLHAALKTVGVTEKLVIVEKGGHGWGGEEKARTDREVAQFLDRYLKKK